MSFLGLGPPNIKHVQVRSTFQAATQAFFGIFGQSRAMIHVMMPPWSLRGQGRRTKEHKRQGPRLDLESQEPACRLVVTIQKLSSW